VPSFDAGEAPRRSTSSLDDAEMATPDRQDTIVRVGCGAVVGLIVGFALLVGTVSYLANSMVALILSLPALWWCARQWLGVSGTDSFRRYTSGSDGFDDPHRRLCRW